MNIHWSMAPCPWVFRASHDCFSWAIMGTLEHPLTLMGTNKQPRAAMRVPECWAASLNNGQKNLTFELISLYHFANISVQISPNDKKSHYGCMAEQNLERLSIAEKVTYKGTRLCSVQKIETFTRRSEPTRLVLETSKLAERILVSAPNLMSKSWTLKKYVLPSAF